MYQLVPFHLINFLKLVLKLLTDKSVEISKICGVIECKITNKWPQKMNIISAVDTRFPLCYSTAHRYNESTINALVFSL